MSKLDNCRCDCDHPFDIYSVCCGCGCAPVRGKCPCCNESIATSAAKKVIKERKR